MPSSCNYPAPQSELTLQRPVPRFLARFGKVALGGIYAGFAAALLLCLVGILMGDASDGLLKVDAAHPAFGGEEGRRGGVSGLWIFLKGLFCRADVSS